MEEWKSRFAHTSSESKDCGIFIVKRIDSVGVCCSWNTVIEWRLEENLARRVGVSRSHDKHSSPSAAGQGKEQSERFQRMIELFKFKKLSEGLGL
jgi:hypothetical protein